MSDTYINSIENARVPIISISISGIEMDIMTAPIPFDNIPDNFELTNIENEKVVNKNNKLLDKLIEAMVKQNDQFYNKSILVLTGFRIAYRNKSKFIQSEIQSSLFVDLMRAVKLWAKRKQIYSNVFGYLSGTILTIMAAKVNLLYNSGGLTFLLQQFFKFYSEWQWPLPVLIEPLTSHELIKTKYLSKENNYLIDSWNLSNIKETPPSVMPIISSKFPEQNVAFNKLKFAKTRFEERLCNICGIDEHWTVWLIGINLENNGENINKQKEKELLLTINEHFWKINKEGNWLNAIYVNQHNLKNMWVYIFNEIMGLIDIQVQSKFLVPVNINIKN
uniref:polynucleotide adenylyltransferase n=1 Tax=Meloidogyne javanica TaxID=6303 RepID=A0A915M1Q0_MELJA